MKTPRYKSPGRAHRRPAPGSPALPPSTTSTPDQVLLINKPYGVVSQFGDEAGHPGLGRLLPELLGRPFRVAGRLDRDSEGLLVITDSGRLQARITEPRRKLPKTYWVQVEGTVQPDQLVNLAKGVVLNDGPTQPTEARLIPPPALWPRTPPVRYRAAIPTQWLELRLTEGRNRQVRRMTAAVGLPTLRLVRMAVGPWQLAALQPGEHCWIPVPPELKPI